MEDKNYELSPKFSALLAEFEAELLVRLLIPSITQSDELINKYLNDAKLLDPSAQSECYLHTVERIKFAQIPS